MTEDDSDTITLLEAAETATSFQELKAVVLVLVNRIESLERNLQRTRKSVLDCEMWHK